MARLRTTNRQGFRRDLARFRTKNFAAAKSFENFRSKFFFFDLSLSGSTIGAERHPIFLSLSIIGRGRHANLQLQQPTEVHTGHAGRQATPSCTQARREPNRVATTPISVPPLHHGILVGAQPHHQLYRWLNHATEDARTLGQTRTESHQSRHYGAAHTRL